MNRTRMNKKGVSPIVATILILAITVAAAVVLYSVVTPLLKGPKSVLECQQFSFVLDEDASCLLSTNEVRVSIDRTGSKPDEPEASEWAVVLGSEDGTSRITKKMSPTDPTVGPSWDISPGQQKTPSVILSVQELQELQGSVGSIEVFPVIKLRARKEDCTENKQAVSRLNQCAA